MFFSKMTGIFPFVLSQPLRVRPNPACAAGQSGELRNGVCNLEFADYKRLSSRPSFLPPNHIPNILPPIPSPLHMSPPSSPSRIVSRSKTSHHVSNLGHTRSVCLPFQRHLSHADLIHSVHLDRPMFLQTYLSCHSWSEHRVPSPTCGDVEL